MSRAFPRSSRRWSARISGADAANPIGRRAHLVFVTAYDHYTVQAFAQDALDYLLKPVEPARLANTVSRLRERLQSSRPAINTEQLLQQLREQLAKLQRGGGKNEVLRWIRAQAGTTVRLIAIDDVDYLRSDAKYTIVAWRDGGKPAEAVVRTPLKERIEQVWPYGTLALAGRRSGYTLMLLGARLGSVVWPAHMRGAGLVGGRIVNTDGMLLSVFPQLALGVTASVSVVLAAQELWSPRRGQAR